MSEFISVPFSYTLGALIQVRISALNAQGWSNPSSVNSVGAIAQTKPFAPTSGPLRVNSGTNTE